MKLICINDTKISKNEDLPFDIRGHRITSFQSSKENFQTNHLAQVNSMEHPVPILMDSSITSISTKLSFGSLETWIVLLAGYGSLKKAA